MAWNAALNLPTDIITTAAVTATGVSTLITSISGGLATAYIRISGTFVGTFVVEGSADNVSYDTLAIIWDSLTGQDGTYTSITDQGNGKVRATGYKYVRLRSTAWTSGTANVIVGGTVAISAIELAGVPPTGVLMPTGARGAQGFLGSIMDQQIKLVQNQKIENKLVTFNTTWVSVTPAVWAWKILQEWTLPVAPTKLFTPKQFNWTASGAGVNARLCEKLNMGTFTSSGSVFTDGSAYSGTDDFCTELQINITAAWQATASTMTITYLDQTSTSRTVTATIPVSAAIGTLITVVPAGLNYGIVDITNITIGAASTAGTFIIKGVKEIVRSAPAASGAVSPASIPEEMALNSARTLSIEYAAAAATATTVSASISGYYKPLIT